MGLFNRSPYGGDFRVGDETGDSYGLSGEGTFFYVAYWSPRLYRERDAPPAVGAMRSRARCITGICSRADLSAIHHP
jgi:hypothetical protein